jgi:hypothetical protein
MFWKKKSKEKNLLGVCFHAAGMLIEKSNHDEDTTEGLLMQISLLEKVRNRLNESIVKLNTALEHSIKSEIN